MLNEQLIVEQRAMEGRFENLYYVEGAACAKGLTATSNPASGWFGRCRCFRWGWESRGLLIFFISGASGEQLKWKGVIVFTL